MMFHRFIARLKSDAASLGIRTLFGGCQLEELEARMLLSGTTFLVTSLADNSTIDGFLTLREAITAAETNTLTADAPAGSASETDIITFLPALFTSPGTIHFSQYFVINESLTIQGPGEDQLTLDADGVLHFYVQNNADFTLNDVTLIGANFGAIGVISGAFLTVNDTTFSNNHGDRGGAINLNGTATATVNNSTFDNNSANLAGGAIENWGTLIVDNSIFTDNSSIQGGAIRSVVNATATITNSIFSNNSVTGSGEKPIYASGGAIANGGVMTIDHSEITRNTAEGDYIQGGGIYNYSSDGLTVTRSKIRGNTVISNVTNGNGGGGGGGINNSGRLNVINTIIVGNSASGDGGGIYHSSNGPTTLTHVTVAGNKAFNSAGVEADSDTPITINNSIIALNDSEGTPGLRSSNITNNTLQGTDPHFTKNPDWGLDERWGTVDDDYGDLGLRVSSIAINLADPAYTVDENGQPLTSDLDGYARILLGLPDMGAYEYQEDASEDWMAPSTFVTTVEDTLDTTDGFVSLREAILYSSMIHTDVTFSPQMANQTITLGGTQLHVTSSVSIIAPNITIDANQLSRIFSISGFFDVTLGGFNLINGMDNFYGGAIVIESSQLTLINSTITRSNGGQYAGGIANLEGTVTLINSVLSNNIADNGGAIANYKGTVTLNNSTITANYANILSGGILNEIFIDDDDEPELAIGVLHLNNSIVSLNLSPNSPVTPDVFGTIDSSNSSFVGVDPQFAENPTSGADGFFATADDTLGILHLHPDSQAIDVGDNGLVPPNTPLDLAGNPRIHNGTVDLGAYEKQAFMLGDFNGDEVVDVDDTDLLSIAIQTNDPDDPDLLYDVTGEGDVTPLDGEYHVVDLLNTFVGDFNLDYRVSIADLIRWAQNFGTTSAVFSQGDANFDGKINIADLIMWAQNFGRTNTPVTPDVINAPLVQSGAGVSLFERDESLAWDNIKNLIKLTDGGSSSLNAEGGVDIIESVRPLI